MSKIILAIASLQILGSVASAASLEESSAIFLFSDQHAIPAVMQRYERVAKDIMVSEGKDPSLLRIVKVDQIQSGHLECFPTSHVEPRLSKLNIISKDGQEVACYTLDSKAWPSDSEMKEIIQSL